MNSYTFQSPKMPRYFNIKVNEQLLRTENTGFAESEFLTSQFSCLLRSQCGHRQHIGLELGNKEKECGPAGLGLLHG